MTIVATHLNIINVNVTRLEDNNPSSKRTATWLDSSNVNATCTCILLENSNVNAIWFIRYLK